MIRSLLSAFLMYSRIPAPRVEWREENRRYSLGFFPLVGAVIGGLTLLWRMLCDKLGIGQALFAAGAVLLPIAVTGGIHLDGFCDFTDARSSYADKQKRLDIMADPHIGSFAAIHLCLYLIVQTALWAQIQDIMSTAVVACGYVLSRSLSGLSALTFKAAKDGGSLQSFVRPSHKGVNIVMTALFLTASAVGMILLMPIVGIAAVIVSLLVFEYYRHTAYRTLGGITGDLCGWFLQLCEIWLLAAVVFGLYIMGVLFWV